MYLHGFGYIAVFFITVPPSDRADIVLYCSSCGSRNNANVKKTSVNFCHCRSRRKPGKHHGSFQAVSRNLSHNDKALSLIFVWVCVKHNRCLCLWLWCSVWQLSSVLIGLWPRPVLSVCLCLVELHGVRTGAGKTWKCLNFNVVFSRFEKFLDLVD